ncbi:MAG: hypothetical protein P1V97_15935 [Planctomycetota bacterium]|nr:hypothetical protein [Planctomycetota bacterium]
MNNPSQTTPLNPPALKADKLLVMLLHYRDVVKQSALSECLAIQAQTQIRLGAILRDKQYVSQEHLMRGYQLVYQRFSICAQCAESSDIQKGALPTCPHCGHNIWFKDNPTQIFSSAPATPSARLRQVEAPAPAPPPPTSFSAPISIDPADPFNMPIGYQQREDKGETSRLMATSNRGRRPDMEKKLQESQEMDLGLSMDELDIFQIEQLEAAREAAESAEKNAPAPKVEKKAPAPKAEAPKPAPKKAPAKKAPSPKQPDAMAVSAEFGDWKKVQALSSKGAIIAADQPQEGAEPAPEATPVKATKKGCGKSAALFLLVLGSLAIPVVAYAFS